MKLRRAVVAIAGLGLLAGLGAVPAAGAAYVYAVGHANGLSTPIQSLGKVPYIFSNPVHHTFGGANGVVDNLFGE